MTTPLLTQSPRKKYSMIESGSNAVPWIWLTRYLLSTLCWMVASFQLFGGPDRLLITADSFHSMPTGRVLMFMGEADSVPELVGGSVPPSMKPRFMVG